MSNHGMMHRRAEVAPTGFAAFQHFLIASDCLLKEFCFTCAPPTALFDRAIEDGLHACTYRPWDVLLIEVEQRNINRLEVIRSCE
jgi:hypothetical protein